MRKPEEQFMELEKEIRRKLENHLPAIEKSLMEMDDLSPPEEMARQFLLEIIKGNGEEAADLLSLKMLHERMSMGELVSSIGHVLKQMHLEREVMDEIQKLASVYLAVLSERMFHHFLRAVSSITGMSEKLLRNFARLNLEEKSSIDRKDEQYAGG